MAFDKAVAVDSTDYTIIGSTSGAAIKSAAAPSTIDAGITWQLPINVPAYGETVTVELNSGIVDATYPTIRLRLDGNEYWSFDIESNTIPAAVTISSIYVNNLTSSGVGNATATVHWTTNKPDATTGSVDFGTDTTYGGAAVNESSNYTTVHSVTLAGLSENTKYYYQITSGAGTNTGTFFTTNSTAPAGNPGTLAYTDGSDSNSGMVVVQNENNFAMDGSSYLFWINSNAVCGIHWTAAGGISATNTVIGAGTSVEAASDGYGRAVAAWVNGANIFGSIVDSAMTSTAFNSGFAIASGANPSVVIVWDPFVNNITNGTAEVFADNALYIYDYSNDFSSAVTAIAAGDYIFNTATASCTTAPNAYYTGITATYRHVLSQDTNDYVNSGDSYCIADASSAYPALLPASVADYYVYESSPQALITSYLNTLSGNPLDNIYSPYTSTFSLAQAVVGDLVEVNSAYYRRIASVDEITFGTDAADHIHTVDYSAPRTL